MTGVSGFYETMNSHLSAFDSIKLTKLHACCSWFLLTPELEQATFFLEREGHWQKAFGR